MRRPIRTRRLSIAAMVSLLAFVLVASADIRSYWGIDAWQRVRNGHGHGFALAWGCAVYASGAEIPYLPNGYAHVAYKADRSDFLKSLWQFEFRNGVDANGPRFSFVTPLWPIVLLLLIVPVRWLIARTASTAAFPVITDAKQASV